MLMEVKEDDNKLVFMDGFEWLINPRDIPTVCTWIQTDNFKIEKTKSNDMFSIWLKNLNNDMTVYAMKIN